MKEIILATTNQGKIAELQALLSPVHCISQLSLGIESVAETGQSFIENALIKARHVSLVANKPALADDSGLVVPILKGEPGIYSARYAGEKASDQENINLLLEKLKDIPTEQRQAFFYCAIVLVQHPNDPTPLIAWGYWHGLIAHAKAGKQGFGYDPIFYIPDYQCTAAQLPANIKNKDSHRAQALAQLQQQLLSL
ncbi:ribosomal protein Ham1 [Legionella beliardensis]|uniref:dITP/XTP pyrophosphatase n=1 Tax=Legionella beliardensis TaxID=91822 RepID=A0A378HYN8_9GAMM|nr:RdgB/HAM1 family non-canonical purine NTP pyrophosphatase [Legionella beliardensis]STX27882.1 ribosomal protein Ham1 [Legionella beliardensis]